MAPTTTATATTATTNVFLLVGAVVACLLCCLPTTTTALPHHLDRRSVTETTCAQPTNLQAMFRQINQNGNGVIMLQSAKNGKALSVSSGERPQIVRGSESRTCPSTLTRLAGSPVAQRSLCPYYHDILQLPRGYYPSTLPWAQCKCQLCVENTALGCEAIMTRMAVLRPTGCFQGLQRYEERIIEVNAGCTCAAGATTSVTKAPTTTAATTTTESIWEE